MTTPFDDPTLQLLMAASQAADTPHRQDLMEGLMEGNDNLVQKVLESDVDHGDLLADDFFWSFMGTALMAGDRNFWRTMRGWGYSLASRVKLPSEGEYESKDQPTLASWAMEILPLERIQWLSENQLLDLWGPGQASTLTPGEKGMLTGEADLFDWLVGQWPRDARRTTYKWQQVIPQPLDIMGILARGKTGVQGAPSPEEASRRYDAMAQAYLAWREPQAVGLEAQVRAFLSHPPGGRGLEDLAKWMLKKAPEVFEDGWFIEAARNQAWTWMDVAWKAGAPGGGRRSEPAASEDLFEALVEDPARARKADTTEEAMQALRQWMDRLDAEQRERFLEGEPGKPRLARAIDAGQTKIAENWIRLGARLDATHPESGEPLGTHILRGALAGKQSTWPGSANHRFELWKAVMNMPPHRTALLQRWDTNTMHPEVIQMAEDKRWDHLKELIRQGVPFDGGQKQNWGIGEKILWAAWKGEMKDPELWDLYRSRAHEDPRRPHSIFLEMSGIAVAVSLSGDTELEAELTRLSLDRQLPKSSGPTKHSRL